MLIEERTFPSPSVWVPCGVRFILLVNTTTTNSNQKLLRKIVWKSLPSTLHIEHKSIMQLKDTLPDLLLVCLCCIFNVLAHHNLSNFRHFPCTTSTIFQNNTPTHTRTHKNCFDIKQIVLLPLPVFVFRSPSLSSHSTRSSKLAAARWCHSYHFTMWNSFSFFAVVLICLSAFCNWLSAIVNQLRSIIKWFAITDNRYKQRYLWFTPLWVFLEQLRAIKWVKNTTCLSLSIYHTILKVNFRESGYTFGRSLDLDTYIYTVLPRIRRFILAENST